MRWRSEKCPTPGISARAFACTALPSILWICGVAKQLLCCACLMPWSALRCVNSDDRTEPCQSCVAGAQTSLAVTPSAGVFRRGGLGPSLRPLLWFIFNTVEEGRAAVELTRDSFLHYSVR